MNWLRRVKEKRKNLSMDDLRALSQHNEQAKRERDQARIDAYVQAIHQKISRGKFKVENGWVLVRVWSMSGDDARAVSDVISADFQEVDLDWNEWMFQHITFRIKP